MDISDINKVANRKRMNTDAEKLREKVSHETAKIIKLKVAQDTAYWDLKEKLQQVEGEHERLQQNMVEMQMQHEALSSRHQEELRRRPETLNKVVGTRAICSVLEEYGERLKASLARGRDDARALAAAYEAGTHRVRDLTAGAARAHTHLLTTRHQLDAARQTLREKEEIVGQVRAEAGRSAHEYQARLRDATRAMADQEREVVSLRAAASEADERARLHAAEADALRQRLQEAEAAAAEAEAAAAEAARRAAALEAREQALTLHLRDNDQALTAARAATADLASRLATADKKKIQLETDLDALKAEAERRAATVEEFAAAKRAADDRIDTIQKDFETHRGADEAKIAELRESAANTGRSLEAATATITQLMCDVRAETEARAKLEDALVAQRRDHEAALLAQRRDHDAAARRLADRADAIAREKDDELAKQMTIILECRADNERLHERIAAMRATIDNIQKELTGRAPAAVASPPPAAERGPSPAAALAPPLAKPPAAAPAPAPAPAATASLLYDFLSDSSVDGEALDVNEVHRRFEALSRAARAARAARAPRTATLPPPAPAPAPRFSHATPTPTLSLSQVKNDLNMKDRMFFKNKRCQNKGKNPK